MCICNHISISICFRVQQVQEHDPSSQFSGRSRCRVLVTAASDVTCSIFLTTSPLCSQPWENLKWHHDHLSKRNGQISNRVTSTFFYLPYSERHIEPLTAPLPCAKKMHISLVNIWQDDQICSDPDLFWAKTWNEQSGCSLIWRGINMWQAGHYQCWQVANFPKRRCTLYWTWMWCDHKDPGKVLSVDNGWSLL